jgi:hypothetical protein
LTALSQRYLLSHGQIEELGGVPIGFGEVHKEGEVEGPLSGNHRKALREKQGGVGLELLNKESYYSQSLIA